jgi:SAM-dependent methyltransferase
MSDDLWGQEVAARYDSDVADHFDEAVLGPTVDVLTDLAGTGRALELAVGTGRVALPLSAGGVEVAGIELSPPMADQLRTKPGAERIQITMGDMTTTRVEGTFTLVYLVFNTIMNLLTQDEQVRCFQNASDHLEPGGSFVVEVMVPAVRRLPAGERLVPFDLGPGHVGIDEYEVVDQRLTSHHFWVDDDRGRTLASPHRYVWPAELDLMARLAGMTLAHRWCDWSRNPFTSESTAHVSVWTKALG